MNGNKLFQEELLLKQRKRESNGSEDPNNRKQRIRISAATGTGYQLQIISCDTDNRIVTLNLQIYYI